jgi:hypothetical protein
MKDKMYLAILLISLGFIAYGLYEIIAGLDNYNGGQGKACLGIGILMLVILYFFKKNDKPGR